MRTKTFLLPALSAFASAIGILAIVVGDARSSCVYAQGNACASTCRAAYSDCRIASKGSPSCDAQFQACMQSCQRR
jgi:hypothetical protein